MKLRQLEFVRAVAQSGSFSTAAELCNTTQPSLSKAVAQFEENVDGRLFTRTTRSVELTPFGRHLLPLINAVLDGRDELRAAAAAYNNPDHKLLRIGFSPLIDAKIVDRVIEPYRRRNPDVGIFFKECLLDDLLDRLINGSVDFAIMPQAPREGSISRCHFYSDALFYLPQGQDAGQDTGQDTGHAPSGPLQVSSIPDAAIIMTGGGCGLNDCLSRLFESQGAELNAYPGQAISYQVIEEWAALGVGAAILPHAKLTKPLAGALPLHLNDGRPALFAYEWLWNTVNLRRPHILEFLEHVKTTVPALISGQT